MAIPAPLELYRDHVQDDWIDYNGHMNVAYYVLAFDRATDAFLTYLGLDSAHRDATGGTTFTVEAHVTYQREMRQGAPLRVSTRLLGFDAKRVHYFQQMHHGVEGYLAATCEWLMLYVDLSTRRTAALPEAVAGRLAAIAKAHAALPMPPEVGRAIRAPLASAGRGA
jgi:acyl-CoA thioester hydrolase